MVEVLRSFCGGFLVGRDRGVGVVIVGVMGFEFLKVG